MSDYLSNHNADLVIYSTLIVVSIITGLLIWMGIHFAKTQEKQSKELSVNEVLKYYSRKITSSNFLWGVWQGRFSLEKMMLFVKNAQGELVATITYHAMPKEGVLETIEMGDKKYEGLKPNLFSNKTLLREADSGRILMSCAHYTLRQEYYEGESEQLKFSLHFRSVFHDSHLIKINKMEAGQLISMDKFECHALLLNLSTKDITTIEQLFILASIPRRR